MNNIKSSLFFSGSFVLFGSDSNSSFAAEGAGEQCQIPVRTLSAEHLSLIAAVYLFDADHIIAARLSAAISKNYLRTVRKAVESAEMGAVVVCCNDNIIF